MSSEGLTLLERVKQGMKTKFLRSNGGSLMHDGPFKIIKRKQAKKEELMSTITSFNSSMKSKNKRINIKKSVGAFVSMC